MSCRGQGPASHAQVRLDEYIHELNGVKVHNMSVQDVVGQILVFFLVPISAAMQSETFVRRHVTLSLKIPHVIRFLM